MGKKVGGDFVAIAAAARPLRSAGEKVGTASAAFNAAASSAAGAAGTSDVIAAIHRFGVTMSRSATDVQTQLQALGTIAANSGADLEMADSPPVAKRPPHLV